MKTNNQKPFIKKFPVGEDYFIYDVNSNRFFQVDEVVYRLIDGTTENHEDSSEALRKFSPAVIKKASQDILSMKKKGFFSSHRPQVTYFFKLPKDRFISHLRNVLEHQVKRITLVVSEECNQRCRYCTYSGGYKYKRSHSRIMMDSATMKKAVDFYFSHSTRREEKGIAFFGGEPLVNFGLIKECVKYVSERYSTSNIFNMTTNGTLLTEEKIDFLAENRFSILISIDGPKEIHDRNRVFKNGKGTFDRLMKNLRKLKSRYPEYFKEKIRFNMVLTPPLELEKINDFICNTDVKPAGIKFSEAKKKFGTYYDRFSQNQLEAFKEIKTKTRETFHFKLTEGLELNKVEQSRFRDRFLSIHRRNLETLPPKVPSIGQCILGDRGILVNADGSFNFCSKVDDTFNLGNIHTGFNYPLIENMYLDLETFFGERCDGCWAIRFCSKCIKDVNRNGKLDETVFERYCRSKKKSILKEMKDYIKIGRKNLDALDYLMDVSVS